MEFAWISLTAFPGGSVPGRSSTDVFPFLHLYHFLWVCFVCLGPVGRSRRIPVSFMYSSPSLLINSRLFDFMSPSINQLSQTL